jgi:catechol 2,3-dioxygenase-like lactoylglutathione lyase family enzyme
LCAVAEFEQRGRAATDSRAVPTNALPVEATVPTGSHGEVTNSETDALTAAVPARNGSSPTPAPDYLYPRSVRIDLAAIIVEEYDPAIAFFTDALGFELVEDSPSLTNDGRPKRWVVVRPPGARTGLLLARADGEAQQVAVGEQFAGRVGLFLRVDDFDATVARMRSAAVQFASEPRDEPYGRVAVFVDVAGNRWDLLG